MKKLIYLLFVSLCLFSCTQPQKYNNAYQNTSKVEKPSYKALDVVDSIALLYPNMYVNDVQNEKFCKCLRKEIDKKLKENNAFLQEIPMQFSMMRKKNNGKYALKFECGKYTTDDARLNSDNSNISVNFAIFAEMDEDFAATLEEGAKYTITGKYKGYVDRKLTLPSGNVFDYPTTCKKYSSDLYGTVCLGGFLFSNLQVQKTY